MKTRDWYVWRVISYTYKKRNHHHYQHLRVGVNLLLTVLEEKLRWISESTWMIRRKVEWMDTVDSLKRHHVLFYKWCWRICLDINGRFWLCWKSNRTLELFFWFDKCWFTLEVFVSLSFMHGVLCQLQYESRRTTISRSKKDKISQKEFGAICTYEKKVLAINFFNKNHLH